MTPAEALELQREQRQRDTTARMLQLIEDTALAVKALNESIKKLGEITVLHQHQLDAMHERLRVVEARRG